MTTAFVSGATGYIAQHLIQHLLSKDYKVVGSVRSEAKGEHLKALFNNSDFTYVVVSDLVKPGAFDEALKSNPEIKAFFHTASPVNFPKSDFENLVITPAVEGTKNALRAVQNYGKNVTKFVLTSSGSAILFPKNAEVINEDSWTEITKEEALLDTARAYRASKVFSEQAAWNFIEDEKPHFTLSVVHPAFVFGPQAFDSEVKETLNFSAEIINEHLKLKSTDPLPLKQGPWYDVRDVARAHLFAFENESATGKRLFLHNGIYSSQLIANAIHKRYPQLKDVVPIGDPENVEESLKRYPPLESTRTQKILGFQTRSFEESIYDTVDQILANNQNCI